MPSISSDQTATSTSGPAPPPQSKQMSLPVASITDSSSIRTDGDAKPKPKQARKKPFKPRARQLGRRKREGSADDDEEQGPSSRATWPILRSDSGSSSLKDQGRFQSTHTDTDDEDDVEVTFGAPAGRKELRLGLASSRQNSSTSISKGKGRESPVKTTLDLATAKLPRILQLPSPPSSNASNGSTSNSAIPILPPPELSSTGLPAPKNPKKKRNKKPTIVAPSQTNTLTNSDTSKSLADSVTSLSNKKLSSEKQNTHSRDQSVPHNSIESSLSNPNPPVPLTPGHTNESSVAEEITKKKKKSARQKTRERKEREEAAAAAVAASHRTSPEESVSLDVAASKQTVAVPPRSTKPSTPTPSGKPPVSSKSQPKGAVNKNTFASTGDLNAGASESIQNRSPPPPQQLSYSAEERQQATELRARRAAEKNHPPTRPLPTTHTRPTPNASTDNAPFSNKSQPVSEPLDENKVVPKAKSKNALKRERLERKKERLEAASVTESVLTIERAMPKAKAVRKAEGKPVVPVGGKREVELGALPKEKLTKVKDKGRDKEREKEKEKEKKKNRQVEVQVVEVVKEEVAEKINEVEFGYMRRQRQQQQQQQQHQEAAKTTDPVVGRRAEPTSPALSTLERTILSHPVESVSSPVFDESPRFGSIAGPAPVSFAEGSGRSSGSHITPAAYPQVNTSYQQPSPNMLSNLIVPPGYLLDSGIYYDQQTGQPYIYAYPSQTQSSPFYPSPPIHNAPSLQNPLSHQHWTQPRLPMDQTSPMYYPNMYSNNLSVPPLGYSPSLNELQNSYAAAQLGNMMAESMAAASYQTSVSPGPARMSHLPQIHQQQLSASSSASSSVAASPLFVPRRQGSSAVKVRMDDGNY